MDKSLPEALALLPHGPEFRFIDRLLSLEAGKRAVAEYKVPLDHAFLRGHSQGNLYFLGCC